MGDSEGGNLPPHCITSALLVAFAVQKKRACTMGLSSIFSIGPGSPFRALVSPSRSPSKIAHLENKGSPFCALFSPFRSPSKIAHLENKSLSPTDSPSVANTTTADAKRQAWRNRKLRQHADHAALFSALPATSFVVRVHPAQSTERHPRTEATARAVHPDMARRHSMSSMEKESRREERHARCRRRLLAAAPLGTQLKMKLLLFKEGAAHFALVENTERNRQQGVAPDPQTSPQVVDDEDPGVTPPRNKRRVRFAASLFETRLHEWDSESDDSLPERRSPRLHDSPALRQAGRRLLQIRQRHGLV